MHVFCQTEYNLSVTWFKATDAEQQNEWHNNECRYV